MQNTPLLKYRGGIYDVTQPATPVNKRNQQQAEGFWVSPPHAFLLLLLARFASARFNIIHDCDEVYNYWEPLHYLLYGYGMQTWEYSSAFALRPYIYLLLHAVAAAPAALWYGAGAGKAAVFFNTRAALALTSALVETYLYRVTAEKCGQKMASYLLLLLCISSGMFTSSTALLPSSFVMYAMTYAAASVIAGKPLAVVVSAVVGVVWGWAVAGVAFLPFALYVLLAARFHRAVATLLLCLALTLVPLIAVDRLFYGRWTVSVWNFVHYNVFGGGDSALYGVDSWSFYLRNGLNNFQLTWLLALAYPILAVLQVTRVLSVRLHPGLLWALSPLYVWLLALSALPHKEERFLYVVYPLVCLAAAASLTMLGRVLPWLLQRVYPRKLAVVAAGLLLNAALALAVLLAISRTAALLVNYGAPLHVYRALPSQAFQSDSMPPGHAVRPVYVCVGAEWHHFPSSFFLPAATYRLQFFNSTFRGLLPRPFEQQGGTAAASPYLNHRNQEDPSNYWTNTSQCSYLIAVDPSDEDMKEGRWRQLISQPFVDASKSPVMTRALYIPTWSMRKNVKGNYTLYEKG